MDCYHRLLEIQNQSWFFKYKDFFCLHLKSGVRLDEVFKLAAECFPELGSKLNFPCRLPSRALNFEWIIYGGKNYPQCFYNMPDPPLILTIIGRPCWVGAVTLSVVGSRDPATESLQWIDEELGAFVEHFKPVLVSGGARGVDQAVHSLAIRKKLPTVIFLPSGLGEIYPRQLREWIPQVLQTGGCFVSEYPLFKGTERSLFHHRNRLIAQMGIATVIVQAAAKSGSIMTGHLAAEAGRPTWVVPSHPLKQVFRGNLELLREGATMVCSAEDLSLFFKVETSSLNTAAAYIENSSLLLN